MRRADQINESLAFGLHTIRAEPLSVDQLVSRYMEHLEHRAQAGDLSHRTPVRYHGALKHLARFVNQLPVKGHDPIAWFPDRDFILHFKTYLHSSMISPNGHPNSSRRPFAPTGIEHIVATTCAMVRWAVREGLLPPASLEAFSAPHKHRIANPPLSSAPLATTELIELIRAADLYQLALFSFHIFHGVRVAEPCFVMIEFVDLQNGWMHYRCIDELGYRTKSRIDKQLPVPSPMIRSIEWLMNERSGGPLLLKRRLLNRPTHQAPKDLSCIIRGVQQHSPEGYADRAITGLRYLKKAGAISSDDVRREFAHLARAAGLPPGLTPKMLRHHFATALERADVPYYTRKYLLGHNLSRKGRQDSDVTAIYTHLDLDFVKAAYQRLLDGPFAEVLEAFTTRFKELSRGG